MRGEGFLVAVTKDLDIDKQQLRETVLQTIQELGVNAANAITITDIESLPKTSSGKVQRKKLSEWYDTQHKAGTESIDFSTHTPIQKCFCQTLNLHKVQPHDTFVSLGGDSLSYVNLSIRLERCLGYLPQGWEKIPLSELEQLESQQKLQPQRPRFATMETTILLRALAIAGVVFNHAGPDAVYRGGAMLLFLIASLNFARFQGLSLLQGRIFQPISSLLYHLLIPYFVVALAYQTYKGDLQLSTFLLFGNFLPPGDSLTIFPAWFVQVLIQSIILFALLFNIKVVRNLGNFCPWRLGLILLCVAIFTRLLVFSYMWDTDYLYNRVPHMMMWLFILGWSIYFTPMQIIKKVITTLLFLVAILTVAGQKFFSTGTWPSIATWILVGGMLILWLPYVSVPRLLKTVVQTISASTYYIYLTHMTFIHIAQNTMEATIPFFNTRIVSTIIALIGGVLIWFVLQTIQQWFFERRTLNRDDKKFTEQSSI
jgi:acyl carrier protein